MTLASSPIVFQTSGLAKEASVAGDALVFVDTNIFLDFYRSRDARLGLLGHLTTNTDRIITSSQVEMEYKKHRQREVLRVLQAFKNPDWNSLTAPAFLSTSKANRAIAKRRSQIEAHAKQLKTRIENVLRSPSRYDPVYRAATQLFGADSEYNLSRTKDARFGVRRRAWKRFILGYPPRKSSDTSTGDAINWEWIIDCASRSGKNVVIVSRDTDFGTEFGNDLFLNDWLQQEFRERVSRRRSITLTTRLAEAFKQAAVPVSTKEAADEVALLEEIRTERATPIANLGFGNKLTMPALPPIDWAGMLAPLSRPPAMDATIASALRAYFDAISKATVTPLKADPPSPDDQ